MGMRRLDQDVEGTVSPSNKGKSKQFLPRHHPILLYERIDLGLDVARVAGE